MHATPRSEITVLRARLQRAGLWAKKNLGQHFLVDAGVLQMIIAAANLTPGEMVVEIGPGPGVLTEALLDAGAQVLAFEYDPAMVALLEDDFPGLEVVGGSVLETAPRRLAASEEYSLVANIPYNITNPILRLFLEGRDVPRPKSMVLLVQKEVGRRLAAQPGSGQRGYISVLADYFAEVEYIATVPSQAFYPPPVVDSAIVRLVAKTSRPLPVEQEQDFLRFVHQLFIQRRKQLKNVVAGIRGVAPDQAQAYFERIGLPAQIRAQELDERQWLLLFASGAMV
jgi:16S rRNA (adenine1518-N6/adenine1519-N6)-dimethyltransferase